VNRFAGAAELKMNYGEFFMLILYGCRVKFTRTVCPGIRDSVVLPLLCLFSAHTHTKIEVSVLNSSSAPFADR
jgi:hypothetical protein